MYRGRVRVIGKVKKVFIDVHKLYIFRRSSFLSRLRRLGFSDKFPSLMSYLHKKHILIGPQLDRILSNIPDRYSFEMVCIDGDWKDHIALKKLEDSGFRTLILTKRQADMFLKSDAVEYVVTNREEFLDTKAGYLSPEDIYG